MKILFFIDKIGGGGRERRMAQLVCELDRRDDIEMMAVTAYEKVDYSEVAKTSLVIKVVNSQSHLERYRVYEAVIRDYKPDIIHLWIETPLYCLILPILALKYGCKYVAGFVADGNTLNRMTMGTAAIRFTFLMADAIVSNSRAGLIAKKAPQGKSYVINNGFDFRRLNCDIKREEKLKELGIESKYVVSMAARVNKAKDWMSFLNLAKMAQDDHLDINFLGLGSGELLEYYREEVTRCGLANVYFMGRRNDVEEILEVTDVSVLFTSEVHAEGISNSIMEAMAAGLPVIATEGGGTGEIIQDEINGYIVAMHDVDSAYNIIRNMLEDENQRRFIGAAARKHIQNNFQLSKMCDEYIQLYNSLIKK